MFDSSQITVAVPTSPIPCHPSTQIIDQTLGSIQHWMPASAIHVLCDGVRAELNHRRGQYAEYLERMLQQNATVILYRDHHHQAAMMKEFLPSVATKLVLFCEHDLPIRTDVQIDWEGIAQAILSGSVDCVRLMLTERIDPDHEHLMLGRETVCGVPLVRTRQWSGWTHLASAAMYRRLLANLSPLARCMVEPYAQGVVEASGYDEFKLAVYVPDEAAARRLEHLNGRGSDPKWEEKFTYR